MFYNTIKTSVSSNVKISRFKIEMLLVKMKLD